MRPDRALLAVALLCLAAIVLVLCQEPSPVRTLGADSSVAPPLEEAEDTKADLDAERGVGTARIAREAVAGPALCAVVHDLAGDEPIAGARVSIGTSVSGVTDDSGRCRLAWPAADDILVVRADGYLPRTVAIQTSMSRSGVVSVWLERGVARGLTVVDAESRNPLAEVEVFVTPIAARHRTSRTMAASLASNGHWITRPHTRTDESGRARITTRGHGFAHLTFYRPGYAVRTLEHRPSDTESLVVELASTPPTRVRIVDESHTGLPDRVVTMRLGPITLLARTDQQGERLFASARDGREATFTAVPDGSSSYGFAFWAQAVQPVEARVRFPVVEPVVLVDDRDHLGELRIRWRPESGSIELATRLAPSPILGGKAKSAPGVADRLQVDASVGEAVLRRVGDVRDVVALAPSGLLYADCRGLDVVQLVPSRPADSRLTVSVPTRAGRPLLVELTTDDEMLSAAGQAVGGGPLRAEKSRSGTVLFDGLVAAEYTVRVRARGFLPRVVRVRGTTHIEMSPSASATLSGIVRGSSIRPTVIAREKSSDTVVQAILAGPDGRFRFEDLPCGSYSIRARELTAREGLASPERTLIGTLPKDVTLGSEGLADIELVWPDARGPLRIRIADGGGMVIDEAADVTLYRVHPFDRVGSTHESWTKPLHPDGVCEFPSLPRSHEWAVAVVGRRTGRLFCLETIRAGVDVARLGIRATATDVVREGPACSLVPRLDGRPVRDLVFLPEETAPGRWTWPELAEGSYYLVPNRRIDALRGGTSRLQTVHVAPGTRRL